MSCVGKSIRIQFTLTFKEKHLFCSIFNYICSLIKQSIENKFLIFDFFKKKDEKNPIPSIQRQFHFQ